MQDKPYAALGFGEVMMRLSPCGDERLSADGNLQRHAGGTELNVMSGIARLGLRTGLISSLPDNPIGLYLRNQIRGYGVSDDLIFYDGDPAARLGVYYYEYARYPRKPRVIYDRAGSVFNRFNLDILSPEVYSATRLFHISGVSLALCENARHCSLELARRFKEAGALISMDVNYRASLWSEEEARHTIAQMLPITDILFVSEETSRRMMGRNGTLEEIQRGYHEEYGVTTVASTRRVVKSPRCHDFSSLLYSAEDDCFYQEPPYENIEVIDRIGSGDAYVAGVLYALLCGEDMQRAVQYGNAMGAVKNTLRGDLIATDRDEICGIIEAHSSGQSSEMNR